MSGGLGACDEGALDMFGGDCLKDRDTETVLGHSCLSLAIPRRCQC